MSGGNDLILTLVFLGLAVFVIVKLRSVLGTRTGFERPPEAIRREMEERQRAAQPQDNVVSFPNAQPNGMRPPPLPDQPEMTQADRWKGVASPARRLPTASTPFSKRIRPSMRRISSAAPAGPTR